MNIPKLLEETLGEFEKSLEFARNLTMKNGQDAARLNASRTTKTKLVKALEDDRELASLRGYEQAVKDMEAIKPNLEDALIEARIEELEAVERLTQNSEIDLIELATHLEIWKRNLLEQLKKGKQ